MKKINKLLLVLIICFGMTSCYNLEMNPIDNGTTATVFTTYSNFTIYSWTLYNTAFTEDPIPGDESDMIFYAYSSDGNSWVNNRISRDNMDSYWNFQPIREVNVMLDNVNKSTMTDKEKEHIRSLGYFFRAYQYFKLLKLYGDVPWFEHEATQSDIFGPRDSREVVANNILQNLTYASANATLISKNGTNEINENVINALISRFGLYEGTWRKYHGAVDGLDGTKYLRASADAAKKLIDKNLGLAPKFDDIFNSESLKGVAGILLYREFTAVEDAQGHSTTYSTKDGLWYEANKKLVESYLCADGKPISTSAKYEGDNTMYNEFRNRDNRLYITVCPPFDMNDATKQEYVTLVRGLVGNDATRKNFPLVVKKNNALTLKSMPDINVVTGNGITRTGYYFWPYFNNSTTATTYSRNSNDKVIFRMGEVLVNYAEAKYELGEFDQTVADATINKLRKRAGGVANMTVADINASFDTKRDADVAPLLWEIRRERCIELIGAGFRFDDLKRWKKAEYMNAQPMGMRVNDLAVFNNNQNLAKVLYNGADDPAYKNCVTFIPKPNPGWQDKCYLYPVPSHQIILNPKLSQNPGW